MCSVIELYVITLRSLDCSSSVLAALYINILYIYICMSKMYIRVCVCVCVFIVYIYVEGCCVYTVLWKQLPKPNCVKFIPSV